MGQEASIDDVVASFYEAAAEPELWPSALIAASDLLGAAGGQFFLWDKSKGVASLAVVGRLPEEGNALYASYYGSIDPRRQAAERAAVGTLFSCDENFNEGQFKNSEFFTISFCLLACLTLRVRKFSSQPSYRR
jgi:hypothetical protein